MHEIENYKMNNKPNLDFFNIFLLYNILHLITQAMFAHV